MGDASGKTGGAGDDQLFSASPTGVTFPSPLFPRPPGRLSGRIRAPKPNPGGRGREKLRERGRKWGPKALPAGWGATFPRVLAQPTQIPLSSASHASTPRAAINHLTQLATEHSPKTLPISKTSQKQQMRPKWRQRLCCLFGLIYDLQATSGAEPRPPLGRASRPLRPGCGGTGDAASGAPRLRCACAPVGPDTPLPRTGSTAAGHRVWLTQGCQ